MTYAELAAHIERMSELQKNSEVTIQVFNLYDGAIHFSKKESIEFEEVSVGGAIIRATINTAPVHFFSRPQQEQPCALQQLAMRTDAELSA